MKKMRFFASMMLLACMAIFATSCAEEGSPADSIKGTYTGTYTVYTVVNGTVTYLADPVTDASLQIMPITDNSATISTPELSFKYKETAEGEDQNASFPMTIIPVSVAEANSGYTLTGTFTVPVLNNVSLSAEGTVKGGLIDVKLSFTMGATPVIIAFTNAQVAE